MFCFGFLSFLIATTVNWFLLTGGPIDVTVPLELSLEEVEKENNFVELGGRYRPPYCVARYRTAIIIPFRNRDLHLKIFLHYIHPLLQRQQLNYGIYVINQVKHTYVDVMFLFC